MLLADCWCNHSSLAPHLWIARPCGGPWHLSMPLSLTPPTTDRHRRFRGHVKVSPTTTCIHPLRERFFVLPTDVGAESQQASHRDQFFLNRFSPSALNKNIFLLRHQATKPSTTTPCTHTPAEDNGIQPFRGTSLQILPPKSHLSPFAHLLNRSRSKERGG